MYPTNNCDKQSCLNKLVGVRGDCTGGNCAPFYIEDLEGVSLESLANLANSQQGSGIEYAKMLIDSAGRLMMGDIEMLLTNGQNFVESFGEVCSTCNYITSWQAGGGVKITKMVVSPFAEIVISKIEVLTQATGAQVIVVDNGKVKTKFPFTASGAGFVSTVLLNYKTIEKTVKVSLEDPSQPMGLIVCETKSGCGCSGGRAVTNTPVQYSGLLVGMDSVNQYGFKICANVSCSRDILTCNLVNATPNLFGMTLLYKVGAMYYSNAPLSTRNNRVAGFDGEEHQTMQEYYERLYRERLSGTKTVKGLKTVVGEYMKRNRDACVTCEQIFSIAYATG